MAEGQEIVADESDVNDIWWLARKLSKGHTPITLDPRWEHIGLRAILDPRDGTTVLSWEFQFLRPDPQSPRQMLLACKLRHVSDVVLGAQQLANLFPEGLPTVSTGKPEFIECDEDELSLLGAIIGQRVLSILHNSSKELGGDDLSISVRRNGWFAWYLEINHPGLVPLPPGYHMLEFMITRKKVSDLFED